MNHEMQLQHKPFSKIKAKTKTIEMRLFDEKRSRLSVGDIIIFTDSSTGETIKCKVINLFRYSSFEELYLHHDKVSIGYAEDEESNPNDLCEYYPKEKEKRYGVVGIEISTFYE